MCKYMCHIYIYIYILHSISSINIACIYTSDDKCTIRHIVVGFSWLWSYIINYLYVSYVHVANEYFGKSCINIKNKC